MRILSALVSSALEALSGASSCLVILSLTMLRFTWSESTATTKATQTRCWQELDTGNYKITKRDKSLKLLQFLNISDFPMYPLVSLLYVPALDLAPVDSHITPVVPAYRTGKKEP